MARLNRLWIGAWLCWSAMTSPVPAAQQTPRAFTVADEIELSLVVGEGQPCARFSPDGEYVAVFSERGRLDLNQVEDSLRFYRARDIERFLTQPREARPPAPVWVVSRSATEGGESGENIISQWRWLANSSGIVFLEPLPEGARQLMLADVRRQAVEALTPATETVRSFDVRDAAHYVYTAADTTARKEAPVELEAPAVVGTGRDLEELLFPHDPIVLSWSRSYRLWAVVDGRRFEVKRGGTAIVPDGEELALSPDGRSVVTQMPVTDVPLSWEALYPPSSPSETHRIRAGGSARQYVLLDLQTASVRPLTEAPTSSESGWFTIGGAAWSGDGEAVLLPGTFIKSPDGRPSRPCVALIELRTGARSCVEELKGRTATGVEPSYHLIWSVRFADGDPQRILVTFQKHGDDWWAMGTTEYRRSAAGVWQVAGQRDGVPGARHGALEVSWKQAFNQPPTLVASNRRVSRVVWDPNPQLKQVAFPEASLYTWKDKAGRALTGGLFKPPDYQPGRRYPLVIQTHGFDRSTFFPSGSFPSAFAASELASAGILVLQAEDGASGCGGPATPDEGPCAVAAYEAAVDQLVSEGFADPERIGIIGFSRSCYYVMETLTTTSLHFKAAAVTDGVMLDYFQTLQVMRDPGSINEETAMIGAPPFGAGLRQWLERSPGFHLDKVTAPLRVVGLGRASLLYMWEPYAGLHYLKKPVDLIMLNAHAHVLTNPAQRMAAQTGTVDWFRFWLQDYQDPDPAKADQYRRWSELRTLQIENEKTAAGHRGDRQ